MQREWKTWSQIAIMIMRRVREFPGGRDLLWLEFRDVDDETSMGIFVMDTDDVSEAENAIIARRIAKIFNELRDEYKISANTIHLYCVRLVIIVL